MDKEEVVNKLTELKEKERARYLDSCSRGENGLIHLGCESGFSIAKSFVEKMDEPVLKHELVEVPLEFDKWYKEIQSSCHNMATTQEIALRNISQVGYGHTLENSNAVPSKYRIARNWVSRHKFKAIEAVMYGYKIKEEQWVVKVDRGYVNGLGSRDDSFDFVPGTNLKKESAYKFTDKEKAEAIAVLVDGEVVEYE